MKHNNEDEDAFFSELENSKFPSLKRQSPYLEHSYFYLGKQKYVGKKLIPENIYESLMWARPGEEPVTSKNELEEKNDELLIAVQEAFLQLTEEEQWLYQMFVEVGLSLRFLGLIIHVPKTSLARQRDELSKKLKSLLLEQPAVREYLLNSNIIPSSDTPT
jgi:hypothetical protein|tara:strand:+ start:241 stop:723 length:483 start_codon:yes stop_codon:yes gene_type:complete